MKVRPFILPVLATCCAINPVIAKDWQDDKTYKFTILHTNDNHGRFWQNKYGEYGMPARFTVVNAIRRQVEAEGGSVLLLSGGDINTGVPESDLQDAEPDFVGMRKIGYDAMALGNHEFDNSLDVLAKQQEWAGFPFLSANIYAKDSGERMFKPYSVIDKQGIKIAIMGLTTEDTAKIGNPEYLANVEFRDPKEEAKAVVAELQEEVKPDMILAVTHMGHYDDGKYGYNAPGDVSLARAMPEGAITAVIGGHSQEPVCMESENLRDVNYQPGATCVPEHQNGTWIMQAHEWGKYVGRADFEFKNGEVTLKSYRLIPINLKKKIKDAEGNSQRVLIANEIAQNKEMLKLLGPYLNKGKEQINIKVGSTNKLLVGERNKVRFGQTNLGRLIATAQMEKAKADFGIMNSGGVRASIETGDITYKEVLTVQPFANLLVSVEMTGKEVLEYLAQVATKPTDTGAYAQFAGISMTVKADSVEDVKIGGEPLDLEKTYRISMPSFSAAGGDGYPKVSDLPSYVDTGFVDADVLKEYLEQHNPLDADAFEPKGEIVYQMDVVEEEAVEEAAPEAVEAPAAETTAVEAEATEEAPATETPAVETEATEEAVTEEAPATETPAAETEATEEAVTEEAPAIETPAVEAEATTEEAVTEEAPAAEAPAVEAEATEEAVTEEAPATETPAVETEATEEAVTEEAPATEAPAVEAEATEEAVTEEVPATETPAVEAEATEEAVTEEAPATEAPAVETEEAPATEIPAVDESAVDPIAAAVEAATKAVTGE